MKNSAMPFLTLKRVVWAMLAVSFIGFLDAAYLATSHYLNFSLPCSILNGCELVTTSEYSLIFGIPVALLGALYYAGIFLFLLAYLESGNIAILKFTAYGTAAGLLASVWFIFVQVFILKALCLYCLVSAATSTILFLLGTKVLHGKMV